MGNKIIHGKKGLIIIITAVLLIFTAILIFIFSPPSYESRTHTIVLTEEGFSPETITIKRGDRIEFSNTTGNFFWPASDLHPTHEIYSAFDPREPIPPEKTWTFRFDQSGSWSCHDHLAPYFTCNIIVTD